MTKNPIAVLGLGSIGIRHARNLLAAGAKVKGFDPNPERLVLLKELGGETANSREEALAGAGAAVIASPNANHLGDLEAALERDLSVLAEKPLAHTTDGVDDLLERFRDRGLTVFAGFQLRFHPAVKAARQAFDEGRLGTILWARFQMSDYLPDWRPHQDYRLNYTANAATGGVLFDMIHEFDLANHLLGPAETVTAAAGNSGHMEIESEDIADVVLAHEGGWRSVLHLDYVSRPRQRVAQIAGTDGLMDLDFDKRRMAIIDAGGETVTDQVFPGSYDDDYLEEAAAFLKCIKGEGVPLCDGTAALAILQQVIEARRMCGLPEA